MRETQVQRELSLLQKACDELTQQVSMIVQRLEPVRLQSPMKAPTAGQLCETEKAPLAGAISKSREQIEQNTSSLAAVLETLEL